MNFRSWLEAKAIRTISDPELDQIIRGVPYTSPMLGHLNFVPKSVEDGDGPYHHYFRHYAKRNQEFSRKKQKDRSWIIDAELPDDQIDRSSGMTVRSLDPKHVAKIRRVKDDKSKEKPRDATAFISTFRRLFPTFESYLNQWEK